MKVILFLFVSFSNSIDNDEIVKAIYKAIGHYQQSEYDSAILILKQNLELVKHDSASWVRPNIYQNLGLCYKQIGDYNSSLEYYQLALRDFIIKGDTSNIANTNYLLANLYKQFNDYTKAGILYRVLLNYYTDSLNVAKTFNALGTNYFHQNQFDSSILCYQSALKNIPETYPKSRGIYLHNIGDAFIQKGQLDSAIYYLTKSKDLRINLNEPKGVAKSNINLARAYIAKKESKSAWQLLVETDEFLSASKSLPLQREALEVWIKYYSLIEDHRQKALQLGKLISVKDSLLNREKIRALSNLEIRYETKQKEEALQASLSREQVQQKSLTYQRNGILALTLIVLLLIALGFLLYQLALRNKREKKAIQLRMREQHHRIENNISVLASILSLAAQNTKNKEAQEIARDGEHRLNAMNLLHKKLYWDDEKITISLDGYISELTNYLTGIHVTQQMQKVPVQLNLDKVEIEVNKAIPISLITNELLTNALKHGLSDPDPKIHISLQSNSTNLSFKISDNGGGLQTPKDETDDSFGMGLVKSLVDQINGVLSILSSSAGLKIQIDIPLK